MKKWRAKWPRSIVLIRHGVSEYNAWKIERARVPVYQRFLASYERDPRSPETQKLAKLVVAKIGLTCSNANTPLTEQGKIQAFKTGQALSKSIEVPDVIFVSPYQRTRQTLEHLILGFPDLLVVPTITDIRIREQEFGLVDLYKDLRIFFALHPEQAELYNQDDPYWYRYPQGENVPDVQMRNRDWTETLIRSYSGQRVMAITHHLNILACRANFERLQAERFLELDQNEKPINCGVTTYVCRPQVGEHGRLVLENYNKRYY